MMEKYLEEHSKVYNAESTYEKNTSLLKHLNRNFSGLKLNQITAKRITEYKTIRLSEGTSPASVRNGLRLLGHAFNVAMKEWEWVKENPVCKVSFKELKAGTVDRWLTQDDEGILLEAAEDKLHGQLKDIIIIALNTGMSQEEILKLEWRNINLFRKTIITTRKKTKKIRTIPINETVVELLKRRIKVRHINGIEYVFCSSVGSMIDAGKLKNVFIKTVKDAGIENFRFHDLRHTFATRLVQQGVDLYKVSKLLGHTDMSTTQRYAHHYPESLRGGVEVLDRLSVKKEGQFHDFFTFHGKDNENIYVQPSKVIEN